MASLARDYHEKRNFIRMAVSTPATLTLADGSTHQLICTDLSSSGVQLQHSKPVAVNQAGKLVISSGGGTTSNLEAEVTVCRVHEEGPNLFHIGLVIDKYL